MGQTLRHRGRDRAAVCGDGGMGKERASDARPHRPLKDGSCPAVGGVFPSSLSGTHTAQPLCPSGLSGGVGKELANQERASGKFSAQPCRLPPLSRLGPLALCSPLFASLSLEPLSRSLCLISWRLQLVYASDCLLAFSLALLPCMSVSDRPWYSCCPVVLSSLGSFHVLRVLFSCFFFFALLALFTLFALFALFSEYLFLLLRPGYSISNAHVRVQLLACIVSPSHVSAFPRLLGTIKLASDPPLCAVSQCRL